jgi:uncharacterized membrane protein YgdD (TMEM256/DUF423 family)|uniref:DUF423 domain-containing protein n=2 Tax=Bacillaceae TaxID=186817 RepID=A0A090J3A4_9BACI|nr:MULTISPECIES: DUF423 domain-containing protein [Bacillaceae]MCB5936801.1 DUF423 domain-containing protein [Bacillus sp. DFI.2.34]MBU5341568.1 DUF423 domain-containing protein [Caldifermentibacillus hisashii]MCB7070955.1 DUF423 domain-containing protein [Caldibacillus sp. 210928-DFI.2.22]MCB7074445.1 DUF423 domain-containing protein [Caldibacillus sp. 210928-DFI.2.18]MCB7078405.1 DUF423 domain-containing protein [Caldibacillus thermoamylovorans]
MNLFLFLGALNGFLSVALGAFGAHILEGKLSDHYLSTWQTGVQYQMFHALALLAVGLLMSKFPASSLISWSGWLFFAGIVLFSGSLYILSLTGVKVLGAITPIGGVSFLIAWILLMVAASKLF